MSRTSTLSASANTAIDSIVNGINVLDNQYYQQIDQSDTGCFYFPIPDGNTVFFRGQCDESVQVVSQFNVERVIIRNTLKIHNFMLVFPKELGRAHKTLH